MTYAFNSKRAATLFTQCQGAWRYDVTSRGRDEDGDFYRVDMVRAFNLREQEQTPQDFREPFATEVYGEWMEEATSTDEPTSTPSSYYPFPTP